VIVEPKVRGLELELDGDAAPLVAAGLGPEGGAVGVGGADVLDGDAQVGAEEAEEVDDAELVDGGVEEAAEAEGRAEEVRRRIGETVRG
jgi:hypothetical protein